MRYKEPENEKSKLIVKTIKGKPEKLNETTNDFRFAAAVASFGMLLRNSEYINTFTFKDAEDLAKSSLKNDDEGFRAEMVRLMHTAETLQQWTAKK
jgi:Ca-activated chloride channel family protein